MACVPMPSNCRASGGSFVMDRYDYEEQESAQTVVQARGSSAQIFVHCLSKMPHL
jgi:hypothetical protein